MFNHYGPWATMIDLGGSPQLSTFWRRRLTKLVAASHSNVMLSRGNLLCLAAAALLLMVMPTVRFAAAEDNDKSTSADKPSAADRSGGDSSHKKGGTVALTGQNTYSGVTAVWSTSSAFDGDVFYLPVLVYSNLNSEVARKELGLTADQEKRLWEISRDFAKWQAQYGKEMRQAVEAGAVEKRAAAIRKHHAELLQRCKAIRQQVESLLTADQLKQLQALAIGTLGVDRLLCDPQLAKEIGLSDQQKTELRGQLVQGDAVKDRVRQLEKALKANDKKILAEITPEQLPVIKSVIDKNVFAYPNLDVSELVNPALVGELRLTAEQTARSQKVFADSMEHARELGGLVSKINGPDSEKKRAEADAVLRRKIDVFKKSDRAKIEALLTKEQLKRFDRWVVEQQFLQMLRADGIPQPSILDQIHATPEQKKTLRQSANAANLLVLRSWRENGQIAMMILRPEQQSKLIDALDRLPEPPPEQESSSKPGVLTKAGVGTLDMWGSATEDDAEKPKPPRRLLPPKIDPATAGAKAIEMFDADGDGKLSGAELDKCPGLKAAIAQVDPSGKGEITAEMIAARIKAWQDSRIGRMTTACRVMHNGKPLAGAEVKFVPEKFLGENFKTAIGITNADGAAMLLIPGERIPGLAPGFYRVEITKNGENIPAKYNTETILGQEVARDARGIQQGIKFDLEY